MLRVALKKEIEECIKTQNMKKNKIYEVIMEVKK